MYALIDEAKQGIQSYDIYGTINGLSFTGVNVIKPTVKYQNQSSDTSDWKMAYVKTASFSASFRDVAILRNSWENAEIIPIIQVGEHHVPVGVFYADTVSHEGGIVTVKAYDAMTRFDKLAAVSENMSGQPFDWMNMACMECQVPLGMTREQVELLPNGRQLFTIKDMGDIQSWRDVLYWVGMSTACFATINRTGGLELRTFHSEYDDVLPAYIRIKNSKYGDGSVKFTGLNVSVRESATVEYYSREVDDGYTLNMGMNPFFQGTKSARETYIPALLEALGNVDYTPCDVTIPFGAHYDLGDVLQMPGGQGDATRKFCVMYISWTFNGECNLKSIPVPKSSMSKTDKNIQGLLNTTEKDSYQDYEQKNTQAIVIGDNEEVRIASVRLASNNSTKALIHLEIDLKATANEITDDVDVTVTEDQGDYSGSASGDDIFRLVSNNETKGIVRYLINAQEAALKPKEQWTDGDHVLHLMYVLPLEQGIAAQFDVYMKAEDGTIEIPMGGVWFYGSGRGLVGDGKWDGVIEVEEPAAEWSMVEIGFTNSGDVVSVGMDEPIAVTITDNAVEWAMVEINYAGAGEYLTISMHVEKFGRITEDGNRRITEDGNYRCTEYDE